MKIRYAETREEQQEKLQKTREFLDSPQGKKLARACGLKAQRAVQNSDTPGLLVLLAMSLLLWFVSQISTTDPPF